MHQKTKQLWDELTSNQNDTLPQELSLHPLHTPHSTVPIQSRFSNFYMIDPMTRHSRVMASAKHCL